MAKRIIAVAGATGNQGGSVVKALANDPNYEIRALTRNPDKPAAKELLQYGSNIVLHECDLTSAASLSAALKGAYGFFCVTDYFSHPIQKVEDITEEKEGKFMAEVAKASGIKHFIFSTLPETKESSGGKYTRVYHFDGKDRVAQYVRGLGFETVSLVAPCCYMQNFYRSTYVDQSGTVTFSLPFPSLDDTLPVCDIEHDIGPVVKAVFDLGPKANGKLYPIVSEFISPKVIASQFQEITGRRAQFTLVPKDEYINQNGKYVGEFVANDLWEMFNYFAEFGFGEAGKPEALNNTTELGVHLNSWVEFLKRTGWKGPQ